ncbi:hypothetical protein GGI07_005584 [Coemansia sp. Benny D115]|nr:hypothetical protein GGI07_005584 [Coemansia sp. Benny D115]
MNFALQRALWASQYRMVAWRAHSTAAIPESSRYSRMLLPTKKQADNNGGGTQTTTDLLTKAGYIKQSSAGIFTLMPLAQRVMDKIEKIVDEEMRSVGGQKLAMPNLLGPEHWRKSGRWATAGDEVFRLKDRRGSTLLLGPTHEEEITALIKDTVRGFREYPLRMYQITRKFRDEARPRAGLLRGREFVMKDMYTFDVTQKQAIDTFDQLEAAYRRVFDRIGVEYKVADADSGSIGGSLSKEFHFTNDVGEDTVLECRACGRVANEERARSRVLGPSQVFLATAGTSDGVKAEGGQRRLVVVPADHEPSALKIAHAWGLASTQTLAFEPVADGALSTMEHAQLLPPMVDQCCTEISSDSFAGAMAGDWHVARAGDGCGQCSGGTLEATRAIEVGHIFYLGDRYSRAMGLTVLHQGQREPVQMGCFGIGVSRVLQAAAECTSNSKDSTGGSIRWPPAIAPFLATILPLTEAGEAGVTRVSEILGRVNVRGRPVFHDNVAVDDRAYLSPGFRLNDAQLLGIPVTVVLGRGFEKELPEVEVQLRVPGLHLTGHVAGTSVEARGASVYRAHVPLDSLELFLAEALGADTIAL